MKKRVMTRQKGVALLAVLLIVMVITVLSVGFLSRSDSELACGSNMVLRTQMDYLAESGLEHARGLILRPQDTAGAYWAGATSQQITAGGSDYYDVHVTKLGPCNYQILTDAYRRVGGAEAGRSQMEAELRLDPCISLWAGTNAVIGPRMTINGDVYCNGTLNNKGVVNGDAFATSCTGAGTISGQKKTPAELLLTWPALTASDFATRYAVETLSGSISSGEYGSIEPVRICRRAGDLTIGSNVTVRGMLLVEGNLTISGTGNKVTAGKNVPGVLVTGDVTVEAGASVDVNGLFFASNDLKISAAGASVNAAGGLFVKRSIIETATDSSGNSRNGAVYGDPVWRPSGGHSVGAAEFDGVNDTIEDRSAGSYLNGLGAVTVSVWVKSDVIGQDRGIFFTQNPSGGDDESLGLRYDADGAFGGGVKCIKASVQTGSGYTQIESTSNVQTTEWQHIAIVWQSGTSIKLYINGQLNVPLYNRGALSGTVSGVQKFMVGCDTKGTYWDGMIDDVRVYNRALEANEVYPPSDAAAGLLSHWKLDGVGAGVSVSAAPCETGIIFRNGSGAFEKWGQAAGAFYRSIKRR